jgi:hypothetical protein
VSCLSVFDSTHTRGKLTTDNLTTDRSRILRYYWLEFVPELDRLLTRQESKVPYVWSRYLKFDTESQAERNK